MTETTIDHARWGSVASYRKAALMGLSDCASIPGLILFFSAAGFGALANDAGLSLFNAAAMMGLFYALPAQVVVADEMARGASIWAGAFALLLIAVRLMPLVASLVPMLDVRTAPFWQRLVVVHGIAVTGWLEGVRRLPKVPEMFRMPYFLGLSCGLVAVTVVGAGLGHAGLGFFPPLIAAVLLFLTPIYFLLSMLQPLRAWLAVLPIVFGCILGPVFFVTLPGLDLLFTGVFGGGGAFLIARLFASRDQVRQVATKGDA
ncbi:MAG: AzlC family ABC transporter permease [Pseudomonadota bacterium]